MISSYKKSLDAAEIVGQKFFLNVSSRFAGQQGGSRFGQNTGNSLEFVDHREYQPGDDVRNIDWNAMARSDRLTVKLYREEVAPHLDIMIDASRSMNLRDTAKCEALFSLVALLRVVAVNAGYTVTAWLIKDRCRPVEPSAVPITEWRDADCDYSGNIGETLVRFPAVLRPSGVRILVSDLFWSHEPQAVLRSLSDNAAMLVIMQLLSERDLKPELAGNLRLVDAETREMLEIVADADILRDYQSNMTRHRDYWKKCSTRSGALFCSCVAESFLRDFIPVDLLKNEILMARSR